LETAWYVSTPVVLEDSGSAASYPISHIERKIKSEPQRGDIKPFFIFSINIFTFAINKWELTMANTYTQLYAQLIFSPEGRQNLIQERIKTMFINSFRNNQE